MSVFLLQSEAVKRFLRVILFVWGCLAFFQASAAQVDVSGQVAVTRSGLVLNRSTATYDTNVTITNTSSSAISAPISLVVSGINPATVTLANPSGTTAEGNPYVDVPVLGGVLAPGASASNIVLKFKNPSRVAFTFVNYVFGSIENTNNPPITDTTQPAISGETPKDIFLPPGTIPNVSAQYQDAESGIDISKVKLSFDGVDVTSLSVLNAEGIQFKGTVPLTDGSHTVRLIVADKAGNETIRDWQFGISPAPQIDTALPKDVLLPANSTPIISATYSDAVIGINSASARLFVNGVDVTAQSDVSSNGIRYTPPQPLVSGAYTVYLEVANNNAVKVQSAWGFSVDEQKSYDVSIISPVNQQSFDLPNIDIAVTAKSNRNYPVNLTVNGKVMDLLSVNEEGLYRYATKLRLIDGVNTLNIQATFSDGEVRNSSVQVNYSEPPKVIISSPADKAMLGRANTTSPGNLTGNVERPVTVTGYVNKPVTSVTVNQQQAELSSDGTQFKFDNFFLREGANVLTVVATDANGRVGTAAVSVSVDQTAPILTVESPIDGAITSNSKIDVRGIANDAVEGFVGAPEPTVTVNGKSGAVSDRYFLVTDVPLQLGMNTLTVTAADQFGNARSQEIKVSRIAVGSDRLTIIDGNNQTANAVTELPRPLIVVAVNAVGEPLAGFPINFDVLRGTGSISTQQSLKTLVAGQAARNLIVTTDANGRASVWFTTGKQAGAGANVVRASNPKLTEGVTFVATTQRGAVAKVNADMGINQFAETSSQPLELMSVVIRDVEDNHLPNVPVVFSVEEGDAYFVDTTGAQAQNNGKRIVLSTDKNGLVAVRPYMGTTPGLVRISAQALKNANGDVNNPADLTGNANFFVQVKQAQDGPTSFKGYVYTDKGLPLPGVRLSIGRTALSSTTDETGAFQMENVPPGRIDLFVDGRTSSAQGKTWPSLHFEAYSVRGQTNQLAHPIYLPPLLVSEAKTVGGNEDVILKIPGIAGFQMKVKANSVTFPDGSKVGTLIVSPVTADKLPMAPPAGGAQFGVPAWTVQPAGTRFDPPIEVTLPNSSSQPPGDNIPIVQWDHDLGQFVPMGRATVSEDGAFLVTDAGSGITKAGWGGACVYDPNKCGKNKPPKCTRCQMEDQSGECPTCKPDKSKDGDAEVKFGGKLGFNLAIDKSIKTIVGKLGVDIQLIASIDFPYSVNEVCCSAKGSGGTANVLEAMGGGKLEGSASVSLLPVLKKFAGFLFSGNSTFVPSFTIKASVSGNGSASYDQCKKAKGEKPGEVTGKFVGTFEVIPISFGEELHFTQATLGGGVVQREGDLRPLDIGIGLEATETPKSIVPGGILLQGEGFVSVFLKSEITVGSFSWTALDLTFPLVQGSLPDLIVPVPGF